MTIYEIAGLLGKAFPRALLQKNIQSGFRLIGIYPLDRKIFTDDDFCHLMSQMAQILRLDRSRESSSGCFMFNMANGGGKRSQKRFVFPADLSAYKPE